MLIHYLDEYFTEYQAIEKLSKSIQSYKDLCTPGPGESLTKDDKATKCFIDNEVTKKIKNKKLDKKRVKSKLYNKFKVDKE